MLDKQLLFECLYDFYGLLHYAEPSEKEIILKNMDNIVNEFNLKKEFIYYLNHKLYEADVITYMSNVTFVEFAEGSNHIEVWISTSLLDDTIGSAYLVDIDKGALLKKDKVVKQNEPFIYADFNAPIFSCELALIEEILSCISRDLFVQAKTSFPRPAIVLGVDIGFRYTEEYIENMRRGVM